MASAERIDKGPKEATMKRFSLSFAAALALVAGCSQSPTVHRAALTGRVDLTAMGASHAAFVAIDRRGHALVAPIKADGSFRVSLPERATYHIVLRNLDTRAQYAVAFQRHASQQTTLRVRAGSAIARDLGTIHLLNKGATVLATGGSGGNDECMDGKDAAGAACADDNAEDGGETCSAAEEDASGDTDNVEDQSGDQSGDDSGGGDTSTTEVAVASVSPPAELGTCGDADTDTVEDQSGDQTTGK
jgi:hypothetical protein